MRIETDIGKYSEEKARENLIKGVPFAVISYVFILAIGLDYLPIYINLGKIGPVAGFLAGICFMYGVMQFLVPYQYWKRGLNGERKVINNISKKLGNEHSLFNDVMLKDGLRGGNIDHLIVGPRGIFAVETKNIHGKITVNGDDWKGVRDSPSRQAKKNAGRTYTFLNNSNVLDREIPRVEAIVVLSSKKTILKIEKTPEWCEVIQIKEQDDSSLYDYILEHEVVFSTKEIEKIVQFLIDKI